MKSNTLAAWLSSQHRNTWWLLNSTTGFLYVLANEIYWKVYYNYLFRFFFSFFLKIRIHEVSIYVLPISFKYHEGS